MRNIPSCLIIAAFCQAATAQDNLPPPDPGPASLEAITFSGDTPGDQQTVLGRVILKAADGGLLVEDRMDTLWTVTPAQLKSREPTGQAFTRFDTAERTGRLLKELGEGFRAVTTPNYLLISNAGDAYTEWCGQLLDRFHAGYFDYWDATDLSLTRPDHPLTVILLRTQDQLRDFVTRDVGSKTQSQFGYYSVRKNRIVLCDLANTDPQDSARQIRRAVARAPFNVGTVVHEATHQLAFNSGLHTRYADNPVWLTEGLAMFFETPDLRTSGWKTIGRVSEWRVKSLRQHAPGMSAATVESLISSDARFQDPQTAPAAYAESWALFQYLMKRRQPAMLDYLRDIQNKTPLVWDKPETRLRAFRKSFGDPADFEKPMQSFLKRPR